MPIMFLFGHLADNGVRWVESVGDFPPTLQFEYLFWSGASWVIPHATSPVEETVMAEATAEENEVNGAMYTTSTDLELMHDGADGEQVVGMRFAGINIPGPRDVGWTGLQTVASAVIRMTVDEVKEESAQRVMVAIWAEAADNAAPITESVGVGSDWAEREHNTLVPYELSLRPATEASGLDAAHRRRLGQ